MLRIRNDLFRIRIQLSIFRVPDPDPGKSSGSMRIRIQPILIKYFRNNNKHTLNSIKKKNLNNYLPFSISYYSPTVQTVHNSQFYLYVLSVFADPDPDPGKSSGSATLSKMYSVLNFCKNKYYILYDCSFTFWV